MTTKSPEQMKARVARFNKLQTYQRQNFEAYNIPPGAVEKVTARRVYPVMAPADYRGPITTGRFSEGMMTAARCVSIRGSIGTLRDIADAASARRRAPTDFARRPDAAPELARALGPGSNRSNGERGRTGDRRQCEPWGRGPPEPDVFLPEGPPLLSNLEAHAQTVQSSCRPGLECLPLPRCARRRTKREAQWNVQARALHK
jgi:hypothetical protein